ncbi:hypothetical protein E3N88_12274 [Mikania micrantha]|uniref:SCP domain-containing protein n=1 Tax=Mikania micrantha TaxID=192012 RepID=A0A5N6P808_9ASTR|nr:hypothetical protein E3N88_12274 [Mikania micrantha]
MVAYKTNATPQDDKEFLEAHNKARIQAGMPPFTYDQTLAKYANKHALSHARDCALKHSDGPYGENLFWGNAAKSLKWSPKDAVYAWMKEQKYYNKKTNTCMPGQKCGHYTQIMWRDTKKIGCARCNCNDKRLDDITLKHYTWSLDLLIRIVVVSRSFKMFESSNNEA